MKFSIFELLSKISDLIFKKSKSGEKKQDIQDKKLDVFKTCLANVTYTLLFLVVANSIFPKLQLSDWVYNLFDKLLTYMMGA